MEKNNANDLPFDLAAPTGSSITWLAAAGVLGFLGWATITELPTIAHSDQARVVTQSRSQVITHPDGGVIEELAVRENDSVSKGQLLVRFSRTQAESVLGEQEAKLTASRAHVARLQTELGYLSSENIQCRGTVKYDADILQAAPATVASEDQALSADLASLCDQLAVYHGDIAKSRRSIEGLERQQADYRRERDAQAELLRGYERAGAGYAVATNTARGQIAAIDARIHDNERQAATAADEAAGIQGKIMAEVSGRRQKVASELQQSQAEVDRLSSVCNGARDRLARTEVFSPVDGIVKTLHANTIGASVPPQQPMVEIVPVGDDLIVEGQFKPDDGPDIAVGQLVNISLTARDAGAHGKLAGHVTNISADTIEGKDKVGRQTYYYRVSVLADGTQLSTGERVKLVPGMEASLDVVVGSRSVLRYLTGPFIQWRPFSERAR